MKKWYPVIFLMSGVTLGIFVVTFPSYDLLAIPAGVLIIMGFIKLME